MSDPNDPLLTVTLVLRGGVLSDLVMPTSTADAIVAAMYSIAKGSKVGPFSVRFSNHQLDVLPSDVIAVLRRPKKAVPPQPGTQSYGYDNP
jgi:hypothetical protein